SGGVLSRLTSWIEVVEAVNDEIRGLNADEFLVIDPDSRLTQLGLLPLLKDEDNYLFFESRSYQGAKITGISDPRSIGWLTSCWLNEVFGVTGVTFPFIALPSKHQYFGRGVVEKLRRAGAKHVTTISLGVGGNQSKRVSDQFEL